MELCSHLSLGRLSKLSRSFLFLVAVISLFSCQPLDITPISTTPTIEFIISTTLPNTPIPACVVYPDIELTVELMSENSVHIRITGLEPNEIVNAIFRSRIMDQEKEIVLIGPADEKGVFEDSEGLRSQTIDADFKDWQLSVVHSRGSTCTEFVLP